MVISGKYIGGWQNEAPANKPHPPAIQAVGKKIWGGGEMRPIKDMWLVPVLLAFWALPILLYVKSEWTVFITGSLIWIGCVLYTFTGGEE